MSYKKFETLESFLEIKDVLTKYKIDSYTSFQNFALYSSHNKVERYFVIYDLIKRSLPIQGDVIEFGIWNGNNTVFISKILSVLKSNKKIFGVDHFKGLDKKDFSGFDKSEFIDRWKGNYEQLQDVIKFFELDNISIINSHVMHTKKYLDKDQKFSFVYIDVDLYKPTMQILDIIKDYVVKGSIICFDEGNNEDFPGEQKALEEFLERYPDEYDIEYLDCECPDVILIKK
jgi:hypothetical protein|tara:strand:+ start:173 stop:862 length:690 start_codon:yes stop_codon:yes gene_type:complete